MIQPLLLILCAVAAVCCNVNCKLQCSAVINWLTQEAQDCGAARIHIYESCLHAQQKKQLLQQATAVTLPMTGSSPVTSGVAGRQGPLATCWEGHSRNGLQDVLYD